MYGSSTMWHRAYQWSARNCLHKYSYSLYILCNVKLYESNALGWIMSTCAKLNRNKCYFLRICFKRNIFNVSFHEVMQFLGGTSSRCFDFISFGSVFALKYIHIEIFVMVKISHKFIRIECNKKKCFHFYFCCRHKLLFIHCSATLSHRHRMTYFVKTTNKRIYTKRLTHDYSEQRTYLLHCIWLPFRI